MSLMPFRVNFLTGQYAGHQLDLPESLVLGRAPAYGLAMNEDLAASTEHCRGYRIRGSRNMEEFE